MTQWRRIPWPLWAFVAITLLGTAIVEIEANGPIPAKMLLVAVMCGWLYFLLKGVRWVWLITAALYIVGLGTEMISSPPRWQGATVGLIGLTLLMLPVTREFFLDQPHP